MQQPDPDGIAAASRSAHQQPKALDCTVYRKRASRRTSSSSPVPRLSGIPTADGAAIPAPGDESPFEYRKLGDGRALLIDPPVAPADRHDPASQPMQLEARIASLTDAGLDDHFVPDIQDVVITFRGAGIALAYEIVRIVETADGISQPRRYIVVPRDDLGYIEPFDEAPALAPPDPPADSDEPDSR